MMKKPKIYLHIGTHKTGSTAFQRTVETLQEELLKEGIEYILVNPKLVTDLWNEDAQESLDKLSKTLEEKAVNPNRKYIVSSEHFFGNPYEFYKGNEVSIGHAATLFKDYDVEIIVFLRRQDEFIQSLYMQMIHQQESPDINNFLSKDAGNLDYRKSLDLIQKNFPDSKINVFPFDNGLLRDVDLLKLFNAVIDSKVMANHTAQKANVGFSGEAKSLYEKMLGQLNKKQASRLRLVLQKTANKGVLKEYDILSYEQKTQFLNQFATANQEIAQKYWKEPFKMDDFTPVNPPNAGEVDESKDPLELREKVILKLLEQPVKVIKKEPSLKEMRKILTQKVVRKVKKN